MNIPAVRRRLHLGCGEGLSSWIAGPQSTWISRPNSSKKSHPVTTKAVTPIETKKEPQI